jgi:hypothetical protein
MDGIGKKRKAMPGMNWQDEFFNREIRQIHERELGGSRKDGLAAKRRKNRKNFEQDGTEIMEKTGE